MYKKNIKKKIKCFETSKKFDNWLGGIGIVLVLICAVLVILSGVQHLKSVVPVQKAIKNWGLEENESICGITLINPDFATIAISKCEKNFPGLRSETPCSQKYYIYLNKIDGEWVVDENSKIWIWKK